MHLILAWARVRPWHAGLLTVASGVTILALPNQGFTVVLLPGIAGLSSFIIGAVVASLGAFLLFSPQLHGPLGIATVVLSLASFVTTNLGGLVVGMALGIVGGSLAFGWVPPDPGHPHRTPAAPPAEPPERPLGRWQRPDRSPFD